MPEHITIALINAIIFICKNLSLAKKAENRIRMYYITLQCLSWVFSNPFYITYSL